MKNKNLYLNFVLWLKSRLTVIYSFLTITPSLVIISSLVFLPVSASTIEIYTDQVEMSSQIPSTTSSFNFIFDIPTNVNVQALDFQFCANSPLYEIPCVAPTGFNATAANLANIVNLPGFNLNQTMSNANNVVLSAISLVNLSINQAEVLLSNITNSSLDGPSYIRINLFDNLNINSTPYLSGGLAYSLNNAISISTYVPPYLYFCSGTSLPNYNCNANNNSSYLNFGNLTPNKTATGTSQLVIATNAQNGYTIDLTGDTLSSGDIQLPALNTPSQSIPGDNQFGLNLTQNSVPGVGAPINGPGIGQIGSLYNQPNLFSFVPNSTLASANQPSDYIEYTISYIINISSDQHPGQYATTLTYVAAANF